jgi:diguanylate cyclase (GGDEF)-like protein
MGMGSESFAQRAADATDWRWARENERLVFARLAAAGLFIGFLAVELSSLVPAISPSHVAIWRWALGLPIVLVIGLLIPRCFGKPVTTRFICGVIAVAMAVIVTLIHIAPPTTAMLLTLLSMVMLVALVMSARAAVFVTAILTLAALSLPLLSPPGVEHQYTYAQLAVYIFVLWALTAIICFESLGLRDAVAKAIVSSSEDAVTGAANLRAVDEEFSRRIELVEGDGHGNVGVILLNVTNLTELDRALGHTAADQVIASVADQLRSIARPQWTIARISAEDFLILISDTSERALLELAILCRGAAAAASVDLDVPVRAHVGTALAPDHGKRLEPVLDLAQSRVYADTNDSTATHKPVPAALHALKSLRAEEIAAIEPAGSSGRKFIDTAERWTSRVQKLAWRTRMVADLAVFGGLIALIALTGGTTSPAMFLAFVYVAVQVLLWRGEMVVWRFVALVLVLLSPLLYESVFDRVHPEAKASLQVNSIVITLAAAAFAISVHRSRSRAHAVARRSAAEDPETHLLTRQEFESHINGSADADQELTVITIELRGVDRFTRSAGRSERTRMMIAIADYLTDATIAGELVARLGTSTFAIATPGDASFAETRVEQLRDELTRIVGSFVAASVKPLRIEMSVEERSDADPESPKASAPQTRGDGILTPRVVS